MHGYPIRGFTRTRTRTRRLQCGYGKSAQPPSTGTGKRIPNPYPRFYLTACYRALVPVQCTVQTGEVVQRVLIIWNLAVGGKKVHLQKKEELLRYNHPHDESSPFNCLGSNVHQRRHALGDKKKQIQSMICK
jgi:hypothetical protein